MLEDSQKKMFLDATPMAVACICPTKNCELLIGLVKSEHFAIGRFSLTGECKHYITPMFDDWTPEPIFNKGVNILLIHRRKSKWGHMSVVRSSTRSSRKRRTLIYLRRKRRVFVRAVSVQGNMHRCSRQHSCGR